MDSRSDSEGTETFHQDKPHCLPPCTHHNNTQCQNTARKKTATKRITYINNSYSGLEKNSWNFWHKKNRLFVHMVTKQVCTSLPKFIIMQSLTFLLKQYLRNSNAYVCTNLTKVLCVWYCPKTWTLKSVGWNLWTWGFTTPTSADHVHTDDFQKTCLPPIKNSFNQMIGKFTFFPMLTKYKFCCLKRKNI